MDTSTRSDDTVIEVVSDSEHDAEDDAGETAAKQKITDVSAFRAAAENITELLQDMGSIEIGLAQGIIQAKLRTVVEIHKHFPDSLSCRSALDRVKAVLEKRGYTPENTVLAHSVCPDELVPTTQNRRVQDDDNNLKRLFSRYLGEGFPLGGLAGIPFAGKTGFSHFCHNVREGGHALVLLAPHTGLDCENKLGKCTTHRDDAAAGGGNGGGGGGGSSGSSEYCCRAAVSALNYCCSDRPLPKNLTDHPEDYQMNYILQLVDRRKDVLLAADGGDENTRQADLAKQMHAIAKNMLDKIVNPFFGGSDSTLLILSGISINMPKPFEDFFQPRQFYILKKDGKKEDLFKETFGTKQ